MKSLYDENSRYTQNATELETETYNTFRPIFLKYLNEGFSPREISYTIQNAIRDIELETLL